MSERRSGVDLSAFEATRAAVAADPDVGVACFTTVTTWEAGARARTTARSFVLHTDEPNVRPGFQTIEYKVHVDSDVPLQTLEEIRAGVEATSPMFDNVRNATPVSGSIEKHQGET